MKHLSSKNVKTLFMAILALVLVVSMSIAGTMAYLNDKATVTNTLTVGKVKIKLDETDITKTDGSRTTDGNAYNFVPRKELYVKDPTVTVLKDSEECYVRAKVSIRHKASESFWVQLAYRTVACHDEDSYVFDIGLNDLVYGLDSTNWITDGKIALYENGQPITDSSNAPLTATSFLDLNADGNVNAYDYMKYMETYDPMNADSGTFKDPSYVVTLYYKDKVAASEEDNALSPIFQGISYPEAADPWGKTAFPWSIYGGMEMTVEAQAIQAEGFDSAEEAWAAFDTIQ